MKRFLASLAVLSVVFLASGLAHAQEYPTLKLRFAHFVTAALPGATVDQWYADELDKRTGGKMKMQIFWAESMGKSMELLKMSAQGAADVTATAAGYFPSHIPGMAAASAPVANSAKQAKLAWTRLFNETPWLQEEAQQFGVWPILWHPIPPYHLLCREPVRNLADLKGKKLRSWGEDIPRVWQAIGATPVTVLQGEWYEGLQRGSYDCMMHSWDTLVAYKIHEVGKYASTINVGALISWPQWWNLKRWQGLPENARTLLTDLAREADAVEIERLNQKEKEAIEIMKASGVQFIEFEDHEAFEKMKPDYIAEWAKKMEKLGKGPEAAAAAQRWRELLKESE